MRAPSQATLSCAHACSPCNHQTETTDNAAACRALSHHDPHSDALQPTWSPADTRAPRRRVQSEQMRQLQDTFDKFDAGCKGQLSVRELGACCRCFGYVATEADLQEMVSCNL